MAKTKPNQSLHVGRRTILAGAGSMAAMALPSWAQTIPSDPDVIIIGAGAAGLAAAQTLISKGKTFLIIEAAGRVGGRAFTESSTFGVPFDHGCSWLSSAENPYTELAENWGFELKNHNSPGERTYVGNRKANGKERRQYNNTWSATLAALNDAGREGKDVPASTVIDGDRDFSGVCQTWIGAMDYGVDFKNLSTLDNWNSADSIPNYMIKEGFGALVAKQAEGIPVQLNTPATKINWDGNGVSVDTPAGTISAKACIVTVSTGVLAANAIEFSPVLPAWKQEAIHNVPMGLLAKITLQFKEERFGLRPNNWLDYWVDNTMPARACYFLTWPFDFDLMIGFVGGEFGWEISNEGEDAAIDFALGEVVQMMGSDARKHFVKGNLTDWATNPNTLGAYGAPRPGHYGARAELARPVGERLFFAGEAVAGKYVALCSGAYKSGVAVAEEVASSIG